MSRLAWINGTLAGALLVIPLVALILDEPFVITLATKVAVLALAGVVLLECNEEFITSGEGPKRRRLPPAPYPQRFARLPTTWPLATEIVCSLFESVRFAREIY